MLLLLLPGLILGQDCGVGDKIDCGYMGIDQQGCQDKGCCWQPSQDIGIGGFRTGHLFYYRVHTSMIWMETQIEKT